jgi:hypothetical protein
VITDEGRVYIKRYLAGWTPRIAASLAYGIGDTAETSAQRKLQFEIGRADINITAYDFINNKLVFKAQLPDDAYGSIREIGLFSMERNALAGDGDSRLITSFDSGTEAWINPATGVSPSFTTANTRVGDDSMTLTAAAGQSITAQLDGIGLDLSDNSSADRVVTAANVSANVASVLVRFYSDSANYYTITHNPTAGYRFLNYAMSTAVPTGSPSWSNINMISYTLTATAAGAATVDFDGLRIEDTDTPNPEYVMVAREVLPTPFLKEAGRSQAIEFAIDVSILS